MEDRIPRWLHHCYKVCCEKGGHHRRQAYMVERQYHCRDVIFGWVDLAYDISLISWPTYHWHLCHLLTPFCNHWILQIPYLYLRPLYLSLSNLISLSLVLWHSYMHQNFWTLVTLNFVFTLWTFRLTPQNLQSLSNISSKYYEFADVFNKTKAEVLASHHSYNLQINLEEGTQSWLALYTLFWHLNKKLSRNSLRKTSI